MINHSDVARDIDISSIPTVNVEWDRAFRLIRSIHPPIDLFEDLADPRDWEALISVESKTNPRISESIGRLDLVPLARRVSGPGSSMVMAPFVHASPDRPGRFTTGHYGVYSAGNSEEVAILEVAYHQKRMMKATGEPQGWHSQFRMMVGAINHSFADVRHFCQMHDPDSWDVPQSVAARLREAGSDGVHYRSVRCDGGLCVGAFWPDVIEIPKQADHYEMHWDGVAVDRIYNRRTDREFALV